MTTRRSNWKVVLGAVAGVIAGAITLLAALPAAYGTVRDAGGWIGDRFDSEPTHADVVVDRFVDEINQALEWSHGPTIAEPSLDYFRRHFDTLDPERTHPLSIKNMNAIGDVGGLAQNAPNLAGKFMVLRARIGGANQTAAYGPVTSWVFHLYDSKPTDDVSVYCRVPLPTSKPPTFKRGQLVSATGVWIADGGVENADGKTDRIFYMACSAIGTSIRFTNKPPTQEP